MMLGVTEQTSTSVYSHVETTCHLLLKHRHLATLHEKIEVHASSNATSSDDLQSKCSHNSKHDTF